MMNIKKDPNILQDEINKLAYDYNECDKKIKEYSVELDKVRKII